LIFSVNAFQPHPQLFTKQSISFTFFNREKRQQPGAGLLPHDK